MFNQHAKQTVAFSVTLFAAMVLGSPAFADSNAFETRSAEQINAANELLRNGEIEAAIAGYAEVVASESIRDELNYNLAVAQYRKSDLSAAASLFNQTAGSADASIAARSRFNLGNCLYATALQTAEQEQPAAIEQLRQAISHYRGALRSVPDNNDARANIELAAELIGKLEEEQKQEEQEQDQQNQDQQEQNQDQQSQDQQNEDQQEQDQQSQEREQQEQEQSDQNQTDSQNQDQQSQDQEQESDSQDSDSENPDSQESKSKESKSEDPKSDPSQSENDDSTSSESQDQQQEPSDPSKPEESNEQSSEEESQSQPQNESEQRDQQDASQPQSSGQQPENPRSPQHDPSQSGDPQTADDESGAEENPNENQPVPTGELTAAEEQNDEKPTGTVGMADPNAKDGAMTKQEALKMLQAIRDRDMLRRLQQQQRERASHVPVDRNW